MEAKRRNHKGKHHQQEVADRKTERGVLVNNLLSAVLIGVMSWVGFNIQNMKETLSEMRVAEAVMETKIEHFDRTTSSLEAELKALRARLRAHIGVLKHEEKN